MFFCVFPIILSCFAHLTSEIVQVLNSFKINPYPQCEPSKTVRYCMNIKLLRTFSGIYFVHIQCCCLCNSQACQCLAVTLFTSFIPLQLFSYTIFVSVHQHSNKEAQYNCHHFYHKAKIFYANCDYCTPAELCAPAILRATMSLW